MKLLSNESSGTYLLRMNEEGEFRISYKKGHKVEHIRVFSSQDKSETWYWIQKHEDKKWPSLRRLVEGYVRYLHNTYVSNYRNILFFIIIFRDEKGIINKPLLSAFRDRHNEKKNSGICVCCKSKKFLAAKRSSTCALVLCPSVCLSISKLNFPLFGQLMTTYDSL